jgi:hypothetical protein
VRGQEQPLPVIANVQGKLQECFSLLADAVLALQRENKEVLWGSMVKETMKRKKPSFNESYYGFRTFSQLLEDAQRRGIVQLRRDQKSGSYVVEDLGTSVGLLPTAVASRPEPAATRAPEPAAAKPEAAAAPAAAEGEGNGPRTRRRRSRGRGRGKAAAGAPAEAGAPAGTDEAADIDDHDHDHDEAEEEAPSAAPAPGVPAASDHDDVAPFDAAEPQEPAAPRPERPFLSLFSWVRRDPRPEDEREE